MSVAAISFTRNSIGSLIKRHYTDPLTPPRSSKTEFCWKFRLDDHTHTLELTVSYLSGWRRVTLDGGLVFEKRMYRPLRQPNRMFSSMQYSQQIDKHIVTISEQGDKFDLRIDNESFARLERRPAESGLPATTVLAEAQKSMELPAKSVVQAKVDEEKKPEGGLFDQGFGKFEFQSQSAAAPGSSGTSLPYFYSVQ